MRGLNGLKLGLLAVCLTWDWSGTAMANERVVIGELTWDGGRAIAHVLKTIIEHKLGGQVELVLADQPVMFAAMDRGDGTIDVHPDFWMPNQSGLWKKYIARGSRETVLVNQPYRARQGLFVPRYVRERYGVTSVFDLADPGIAKLFDSDGNGKGEFWAGAPGWAATNIEKVRAKSYGYGRLFEAIEIPVAIFQAKLKREYRRKKPILFYSWTPHWIHAAYELVQLEEPPFDGYAMESKKGDPLYNPRGCWKMYHPQETPDWYAKSRITCAWPEAKVYIAYSASLHRRSPRIARFLRQVVLSAKLVGEWIDRMVRAHRTPDEVAAQWVAGHPDIVDQWVKGLVP